MSFILRPLSTIPVWSRNSLKKSPCPCHTLGESETRALRRRLPVSCVSVPFTSLIIESGSKCCFWNWEWKWITEISEVQPGHGLGHGKRWNGNRRRTTGMDTIEHVLMMELMFFILQDHHVPLLSWWSPGLCMVRHGEWGFIRDGVWSTGFFAIWFRAFMYYFYLIDLYKDDSWCMYV